MIFKFEKERKKRKERKEELKEIPSQEPEIILQLPIKSHWIQFLDTEPK